MNTPKQRILLVDDDSGLLSLLRIRLAAAGYEVLAAQSSNQALAEVLVCPPHLIITDFSMPGMDGIMLCKTIHQCHPYLPVILLTACSSPDQVKAALQGGVFSVLSKPFDSKSLLAQVACALSPSTVSYRYEAMENPSAAFQQV